MAMAISDADYVVAVDSQKDFVKKAIAKLQAVGLNVALRQGPAGKVFIFVKANQESFERFKYEDKIKDWLHEIPEPAIKQFLDNDASTLDFDQDEEEDGSSSFKTYNNAGRLRIVYEIIRSSKVEELEGIGANDVFPIQNTEFNKQLVKQLSAKSVLTNRDIATLKQHFGDEVAMYFSFLAYYFKMSAFSAAIGFSCQYLFGSYSWLFVVSNITWALIFVHGWSRRQDQLAIAFGVKNYNSSPAALRSGFKGEIIKQDPVTGEDRPFYPSWKRLSKRLSFLPLAIVSALILVTFQSLCFVLEIFISQIYDGPGKPIFGLLPTILLVGLTPFFMGFYSKIVKAMSNWENHTSDEFYEQSYGQKLFVFQFLIGFTGLFLSAYIYLPFGHRIVDHLDFIKTNVVSFAKRDIPIASSFKLNEVRLHGQVVYFAVTAQIVALVVELVVPFAIRIATKTATQYQKGSLIYDDEPKEAAFLNSVRDQYTLPAFNVQEEYRQLVIQFGYSLLFSPVWSYSTVTAFINNFLQLRGDLVKLSMSSRRPIPRRSESIGPWIKNLKFLVWLSSLTAPSVVAMFGPATKTAYSPDFQTEKSQFIPESLVKINPQTLVLVLLVSEHLYFIGSQVVSSFFQSLTTPEFDYYNRIKYRVRKELVSVQIEEPKLSIKAANSDWPTLTGNELEKRLSKVLTPPKSSKEVTKTK